VLEHEFRHYLEHQDEFASEYEGKVLVIKDQKVIGVYDSEAEALNQSILCHELGSFLIQACSKDPNSTVRTFLSRVS